EVGAVDLGGGPEAEDLPAVRIVAGPSVRHVQVDRAGDSLDGQLAGEDELPGDAEALPGEGVRVAGRSVAAERAQPRPLEDGVLLVPPHARAPVGQGRVPVHVEEVGAAQVRVPLLVARGDAGRLDDRGHRGPHRVLRHQDRRGDPREQPRTVLTIRCPDWNPIRRWGSLFHVWTAISVTLNTFPHMCYYRPAARPAADRPSGAQHMRLMHRQPLPNVGGDDSRARSGRERTWNA